MYFLCMLITAQHGGNVQRISCQLLLLSMNVNEKLLLLSTPRDCEIAVIVILCSIPMNCAQSRKSKLKLTLYSDLWNLPIGAAITYLEPAILPFEGNEEKGNHRFPRLIRCPFHGIRHKYQLSILSIFLETPNRRSCLHFLCFSRQVLMDFEEGSAF